MESGRIRSLALIFALGVKVEYRRLPRLPSLATSAAGAQRKMPELLQRPRQLAHAGVTMEPAKDPPELERDAREVRRIAAEALAPRGACRRCAAGGPAVPIPEKTVMDGGYLRRPACAISNRASMSWKDREIRRSHTRLALLSDTILSGGAAGSRAEVIFRQRNVERVPADLRHSSWWTAPFRYNRSGRQRRACAIRRKSRSSAARSRLATTPCR